LLTHRAAVLGKPIAHSLSPVVHNAGYAAAGLDDWSYTAIECAESELADLARGLGPQWAGLSLTMPLKDVALAVADEIGPVAAAIGAANTLVRLPAGRWRADNTDAPGMVDALRAAGVGDVASVAVLGAGGTARAALAAVHDLGVEHVTVYARRPEAVDDMRHAASALGVSITYVSWTEAGTCAAADLVVSTVPKGVADALEPAWRSTSVLFDAVYDPWPTTLAAGAQAAGATIVSGLDLLLHQAVHQFFLFTGVAAPIDAMNVALREAAARRGDRE
jgi:shikimate dehydrogenase